MDALGLLLTATGVERRLGRGTVTQDLVTALVVGAVMVGCAVAVMGLLAAALTVVIADRVGDWVSAILIAAAIFAVVGAALGLFLRWRVMKTGSEIVGNPAPAAAAAATPAGTNPGHLFAMAEAAGLSHPRSIWDIATLVALGFVSGLPGKVPPAS